MKRIRSRVPFLVAGVLAMAAIVARATGLRLNTTASMPRGLYREVRGLPIRGTLVAVCLPESIARFGLERYYLGPGSCPGGAEPVLKQVTALGGDLVEVTPSGVVIDGTLLEHSRPFQEDRAGRALEPFESARHVLSGAEIWLHSPYEERSWDSRYYGPVPVENALAVVEPVWTVP
jgi:conjugative transfer signal peptidase TraF